MTVMVIDGQGGQIGRELVRRLKEALPGQRLLAVGTNSLATANMLKGGAEEAATGENAVIVGARKADVIVGTLGIVICDALLGEVTPAMAQAVGQSDAVRVLIPLNRCGTLVAGVKEPTTAALIDDAVEKVIACVKNA